MGVATQPTFDHKQGIPNGFPRLNGIPSNQIPKWEGMVRCRRRGCGSVLQTLMFYMIV
jgi:hypothetical protein